MVADPSARRRVILRLTSGSGVPVDGRREASGPNPIPCRRSPTRSGADGAKVLYTGLRPMGQARRASRRGT